MKKSLLIAALAVFGMGATAVAAYPDGNQTAQQQKNLSEVTITKPRGVINTSGDTRNFQLTLRQSKPNIVAYEVKVIIDNRCVGRKPVIIQANMLNSDLTYIKVGTNYKGKTYKLEVSSRVRPDSEYDDNM